MNKDLKRWILTFGGLILGAVCIASAVEAGEWITAKGLAIAAAIGWASRYIVGGIGVLLISAVVWIRRSGPFLDRVLGWLRWTGP